MFHEWENGAVRIRVAEIYPRFCSFRLSEAIVTLDRMILVPSGHPLGLRVSISVKCRPGY